MASTSHKRRFRQTFTVRVSTQAATALRWQHCRGVSSLPTRCCNNSLTLPSCATPTSIRHASPCSNPRHRSPLPSRRFSRRSSSHPRVPSQPMAAVQQSRPITCRCRSIGISTHLVPSRAINASRRHFSCKPQSLNKPSRPTSSRPWHSSTAPCLCWTSNWRFSWLPTVCGTSRLKRRRYSGRTASLTPQRLTRWSLPT